MGLKRWQVYRRDPKRSLIEHLCRVRGLVPTELTMDFRTHLHSPNLLPNMSTARKLMVAAVEENWPIAIFGDYDADGTPAAALLGSLCEKLGLIYEVYLPTRQTGYGLSESYIQPIADQAKLLITVDTGITSVESITELQRLGVKTIILDHHLPPTGPLPPADAIVDPFLEGSKYPFPHICGCALAYKFAEALSQDFPAQLSESFLKWQLDLVAISTVADMMIMRGENRPLVDFGLKVLKKTRRPGLAAMIRIAGLKLDELTAGSLGYSIGPRFNAAGRMGDNRPVYDLLATTDPAQAEELATVIERLNRERQALVEKIIGEAERVIWEQNNSTDFVYVIVASDWAPGVVGLVAGRLAEKYYRPVVVGCRTADGIRGSARSVGDYPIIDGLSAASRFIDRFGGHRQAAGLTVSEENWSKFADVLKRHAAKLHHDVLPEPKVKADDFLLLAEATMPLSQELTKLEPHGLGNSRPTFIIRDVELQDVSMIGEAKNHLRMKLSDGTNKLSAIGFGLAKDYSSYKSNRADVIGHLSINNWQGQSTVQFQVIDFHRVGTEIDTVEMKELKLAKNK